MSLRKKEHPKSNKNYVYKLQYTALSQVQDDLMKGNITAVSLAQTYLENINLRNKELNAFLEVYDTELLQNAADLDEKIQNKEPLGKLFGLVLGLKDNLCYKNHKVSASSKILEGFESQFTATAVQRLIDQGAMIIGRLNCDEFAMGASNENSAFGAVKNSINQEYVPGGSSGGSAVAVEANMCFASLGSDTGGSIRQPASFLGLVGSKPTYGRISRHGLIAYASSFDQIGPITQNVDDNALLTQIMSGKDENDATCQLLDPVKLDNLNPKFENLKIAYIEDCLTHEELNSTIKESSFKLFDQLKGLNHEVEAVNFELLNEMVPCYYVLTTAEASSNLSRFSGLTYGKRSKNSTDLESTFTLSRTEGFGEEVKRRIMLGTFVLSSNHYDAYYTKAQKVRALIKQKTDEILNKYDFIILPTTSSPAFKLGEKANNPIQMYLADLFTVQANLAGNPAISIPLGKENDMPFGIQIIAKDNEERKIFEMAKYLEELIG